MEILKKVPKKPDVRGILQVNRKKRLIALCEFFFRLPILSTGTQKYKHKIKYI